MRKRLKIATIVGARPNFVKVAPLHHAIEKYNNYEANGPIHNVIIHTGQHHGPAMSDQFFDQFGLPAPHYNLAVAGGSHAEQTGNTMIALEKVLCGLSREWVVVLGDVNATLAAAITAKKLGIRVAHIEAGLRSNDWSMPEEINRVIVDRISDLLLTTSEFADKNLHTEGVPDDHLARVGNIMIDSLLRFLPAAQTLSLGEIFPGLIGHPEKNYVLVTLHRPSNVDSRDQLIAVIDALKTISKSTLVIFPLHPRTRLALQQNDLLDELLECSQIFVSEPMGYLQMLALQVRADVVITDSGGIQEEAMVLGVPCVTLRSTTERPETLKENGGTSRLVATTKDAIVAAYHEAIAEPRRPVAYPLWDGHAAERIVAALVARS